MRALNLLAMGLIVFIVLPNAALAQRRLPLGIKWGRCLLVVNGQTRISGLCSYKIGTGGAFRIDGPRQVFEGIDYPAAKSNSEMISKDYWAEVYKDGSQWNGYGNSRIGAVHGDPEWGVLHREGACLVGRSVRVCLWGR